MGWDNNVNNVISVITLERNDAKMIRWIYNVKPDNDKTSVVELTNSMQLKTVFIDWKSNMFWSFRPNGKKFVAW